ncbi:PP2C family serine/threonine-protein phosphatase [Frankia sp. Cppng1_Ct_nod]|uniref:PP2C family protein-serine/threonine phosphatase n=1 Tax=Frankia sp. Cppng1_Ct_nod TaxID=2897162 RepID=UPI0010412DE6|nr:PP2C family serine/threonine-protein phosphatase [Frankia sp. Cppng1_Ct_nod]
MDSSVVPITLIVVLLIGAIVFVVVSSHTSGSRSGPEGPPRSQTPSGRTRPGQRRRQPSGILGTRRRTSVSRATVARATSPAATVEPSIPGGQATAVPTAPIQHPATAPARALLDGEEPDVRSSARSTQDSDALTYVHPAPSAEFDHRGSNITGPSVQMPPPADAGHRATTRDSDSTGWTPPPFGPPPVISPSDSPWTQAVDEGTVTHMSSGYPGDGGNPNGPGSVDPGWDSPTTHMPLDQPTSPPPHPFAPLVADEPDVSTSPALRLAAAGRTRRGKRGGPNEDAFVVVDGLLAVADGVGGEAAGQIASTLAVTTVASFRPQYAADPREGLRGALDRANRTVREKPLEEPSWLGMACTLDVVVLGRQRDTGETLFVAHVGDSSVWLQPGRGRPRQLTTPHAIKNGPLLNAIGLNDEVELDLLEEPVQAGDRVVLASDGITKVMTPEQLDGLLMELGTLSPERAADALVDAAMIAGARDDTTIVVGDLVTDSTGR